MKETSKLRKRVCMKVAIDIPDELYCTVQAKAAQERRKICDVTIELFQGLGATCLK